MGKGGGGGGAPQQTTATQYSTNIPEYAKPYVMNMLNAAQAQVYNPDMTSFREYKPYSTDPTQYFAGPSSLQTSSYNEAGRMQTPGQFNLATGLGGVAGMGQLGAGAQYQQMATDPRSMQAYMSPYMQNAVDVQKMAAVRDYEKAMPGLAAQAVRQGAFGGSRSAIERSEAQRTLAGRLGEIQAQGTQAAFDKAQQAQQFGANLGLQGLQGASQTAGMLGQLGGAQQQADIARLGLQNQFGQQQQGYQQNIINQAIQDYATQQQYPMIQLANMSNLLRGLPMQSGTTQMYQAAPSVTSQIAGLGTAGVGAYGLGKAAGVFKEGGQVKGYKYGGLIPPEKLRSMADSLTKEQLQAQLRDPSLDEIERQIFEAELRDKSQGAGIAGLPAGNLDGMGMAGGGIIAFAEGDLVDDEEDDSTGVSYTDESDDDDMVDALLARGIAAGAYGDSRMAGNAGVGINPNAPSGEGIRAEAKAPRGIEALTAYVLNKESGGRRYAKDGSILTSSKGAEGEMQVMPMTQRDPGYGVKAARDDSPEEKARVGRDYLAALYNKYGDEKLAAIAYNMGPGATDKWLKAGADVSKLPKETRGYIAQLAGGGVVAFQAGGLSKEEIEALKKPYIGYRRPRVVPQPDQRPELKGLEVLSDRYAIDTPNMVDPTKPEGGAVPYVPGTDDTYDPDLNKQSRGVAMVDENAAKKELDARAAYEKQVATEKEKSGAGISKLEEMLLKREQGLEKQGAIDSNLALIMAGLGMAGGTSRNALENISKGAQVGMGTYMAGAKQRAAGENAILSGRLGIEKMRGLQDIRQAQMDQNLSAKIGSQIGAREKQIEQFAYNTIAGKGNLIMDSAEAQAAIAKEVQRLKSQDPLLGKLYSQYGLPPIQSGGAPTLRSPEDIKKQFKIS